MGDDLCDNNLKISDLFQKHPCTTPSPSPGVEGLCGADSEEYYSLDDNVGPGSSFDEYWKLVCEDGFKCAHQQADGTCKKYDRDDLCDNNLKISDLLQKHPCTTPSPDQ